MRRVHHLGVELHAVEMAFIIRNGGKRRAFGNSNNLEPVREFRHAVAVAHPDLLAGTGAPDAFENRAGLLHLDVGAAEFLVVGAFDLAAKLLDHRLLAVANAEQRQSEIEYEFRRARGIGFGHAGRAAGENNTLRREALYAFLGRLVERPDFAVNAVFAKAPGDELRDLRAEIEDQDAVVALEGGGGFGGCLCHGIFYNMYCNK